jgi:hypothetical protein
MHQRWLRGASLLTELFKWGRCRWLHSNGCDILFGVDDCYAHVKMLHVLFLH